MRLALHRAAMLAAALHLAGGIPGARAAHSKDIDRLYLQAVAEAQKADYWHALHDAESVLRADPGWSDAQQLRRTAGYEAHFREALRLIDSSDWSKATRQLEEARVYKDAPVLAAKLRLVRAHLEEEETAQQSAGRYAAALSEARSAAQRGDFATARARLSECLQTKPGDAALRAEIEALDARAASAAALGDYLASVTGALAAGDWKLADQRIRLVPSIPDPPPPVAHAALLGPLRLYAAGRAAEARDHARLLFARQSDSFAGPLLLFLNARVRVEAAPVALAWMGPLYAAALAASLYFGLRRELRGRAA